MMEPLIVVHQLRAKVGREVSVEEDSVELEIDDAQFDAGKLHLLVGGNGAGKSTFVRTLLGFQPIQSGAITWRFLCDRKRLVIKSDSRGRTSADLFQHVGYVPQGGAGSLWPHVTVRDHVAIPLRLKKWKGCDLRATPEEREKHVDELLHRAQVSPDDWDRKPGAKSAQGHALALSSGEAQRVAYARAITGAPYVLILDELEASLDEVVKRQFIDTVTRDFLAPDSERTAIVVTHDKSSWLTGRWDTGDRIIWSFLKNARAKVSLTREPPTRPASPYGHFRACEELFAKLRPLCGDVRPPIVDRWNSAGWAVCKALTSFIKAVVEQPRMILTVFGPSIVSGKPNYGLPVLLGATGPIGEKLHGRDSGLLEQFASQSEPHVFPDAESHDPPTVGRRVVRKGLILELFRLGPAESYKGKRLDEVDFGNVDGESFYLLPKSVNARGEKPNYLELSHSTEAVYLFSVIDTSTQARLVTAIDSLNPCSLDEYQRYSVLQALCHTLESLATA